MAQQGVRCPAMFRSRLFAAPERCLRLLLRLLIIRNYPVIAETSWFGGGGPGTGRRSHNAARRPTA